jgi:hypothetical protein|tara:strand:+ start:72 stop:608 length:537 start_codon:yes stop_codon:yes gene_type:complete
MSRLYNTFKNLILKGGAQKTTGEAKDFVKVAKNLKKKRDLQDDVIKTREKVMTEYGIKDPEKRVDVRKTANQAKINKKMSDILESKAKGGRVGLRKGTPNPFGRKSNTQKIAEVFGPKRKNRKEKIKEKIRMMAKKGGAAKKKKKFPDLTGDGKVTFADILKGRGVINGKKKPKKKII